MTEHLINWLIGIDYTLLIIAVCYMVFDYITGVCKGAYKGQLSSTILRKGLWHKLALICAIVLAIMLEKFCAHAGIDIPLPLTLGITVYIVFTETVSILENLGEINPRLRAAGFMKFFSFVKNSDVLADELKQAENDLPEVKDEESEKDGEDI